MSEAKERATSERYVSWGVTSLGKGRWFWVVFDGYDAHCDGRPLGSGYATDKLTAARDAHALMAAHGIVPDDSRWPGIAFGRAYVAASYHRRLCVARRAAKPPSPDADASPIEYVWAWFYPFKDCGGEWRRFQVVKKTAKRIYVDTGRYGYSVDDRVTCVIDRAAFERDGYAKPAYDVLRIADGFYAQPFDRGARYRRSVPVPPCFDVLGLDRGATGADVERADRRLARTTHPDAGGDPEAFIRLRTAYEEAIRFVGRFAV